MHHTEKQPKISSDLAHLHQKPWWRSPTFWLVALMWAISLGEVISSFTRFGSWVTVSAAMGVAGIGLLAVLIWTLHQENETGGAGLQLWTAWLLLPALALGPLSLVLVTFYMRQLDYVLQPLPFSLYTGFSLLTAGVFLVYLRRKSVQADAAQRFAGILMVFFVLLLFLARWTAVSSFKTSYSDMLPAIQMGLEGWMRGENLYAVHCLETYCLPAPYFPLTELSFLPLALLQLDYRWLSVLAAAGITWLAWRASPRLEPGRLAVLGVFLIGPLLVVRFDIYLGIYWFLLAWFSASLMRGQFVQASIALGLVLASHQMAIFLPLFYVIYIWRVLGWKSMLAHGGLSAIIMAVILLAFYLPDPDIFIYGLWGYGERLLEKFQGELTWQLPYFAGIGFGPLFNAWLGTQASFFLKLGSNLLITLLALWWVRRPLDVLVWASIGLAVPLLLHVPAESYLFTGVFIMLLFAAVGVSRDGNYNEVRKIETPD